MNEDILVEVNNVSKKFCKDLKLSLWYGVKDLTSSLLGGSINSRIDLRKNEFWAVKGVSFQLARGECLGLIGHNGAGKSTLLKMLNGLIRPDEGEIKMRGRVGALIELGAGFNPVLTARENIYINGQVLGLSKKEIDRKFDAIVDFAEVREFIDTPIQNFSSGMKVRLGFAVAAQMEPDILIIDEVLAVGDARFRAKCYDAISEMMKNASVIFVSHSLAQISRICTQVGFMEMGQMKHFSNQIAKGIALYQEMVEIKEPQYSGTGATIHKVEMEVNGNRGTYEISASDNVQVHISFSIESEISNITVGFNIFDAGSQIIINSETNFQERFIFKNEGKLNQLRLDLGKLHLAPGAYSIMIYIQEIGSSRMLAKVANILKFKIKGEHIGFASIIKTEGWKLLD